MSNAAATVAACKRIAESFKSFTDADNCNGVHALTAEVSEDCGYIRVHLNDEDSAYGGHVSRRVSLWWSSLTNAQRQWIRAHGRAFHCKGRLASFEIYAPVRLR